MYDHQLFVLPASLTGSDVLFGEREKKDFINHQAFLKKRPMFLKKKPIPNAAAMITCTK
jgi:hypothetical protein